MDAEKDACNCAIKLASLSVLPMTIFSAIELGLFQHIAAAGPGEELTADELAARIGATNPLAASMLERILRLLASHSVFTCSTSTDAAGRTVHRYGPTPVCRYLAPSDDGVSLAALCLMASDRVSMESWYHVKDSVLHGGVPFNMAHGGLTEFEYHNIDPRFSKVFNEGMRSHSIIIMKNILEIYQGFDDVTVLVDVGGGTGGTLSMITAKHSHIKGINFDLPHVIAQAPPLPGVEHIGGDVFASVPSGDAIFMKWILHDWSDEDSLKILSNCRKALPEKGKVIVVDSILPESPESSDFAHCVFHVDLIMMLESPSGKERTEKEFRDLAMNAGFSAFNVVCNFSNASLMEFTK
ncbi:Tricetin 3',4',5'-O-trimethyltransferase [Apostasia shenzhenica]|uniref:Tricetin 3',4',5'-O-trimethyltransferase n=1 Tax=Apostasia shenzhenica TaxID=1088818 RepID=A0A2I0B3Q1_9ASPA|nr:Tricetin 3',4',5'-O-trimethyltransferase [Apostasia shenzhenica]